MNLTSHPDYDGRFPDWSPGAFQIAFESNRDGQNYKIYVMNADDGSDQDVLPSSANSPGNHYFPNWSADGIEIAFASGSKRDIHVMDVDGLNDPINLTSDLEHDDLDPAWSLGTAQ